MAGNVTTVSTGKYTVEVRDPYGRLVTELTRAMNKQFDIYRNRAGHCQFVLDLYDPQAITSILSINRNDIVIRRFGTPVFAGQISYVHPSIDGDKKTVEVIATGYFDYLDFRIITADFPGFDLLHYKIAFDDIDVGQIAWTLINYSQYPLTSDGYQLIDGTRIFCQSFVSSGSSTLDNLKLLLKGTSPTGYMRIKIVKDFQNLPIGTQVGTSVTILGSTITTDLAWNSIDMTGSNITLEAYAKYWIVVDMISAQTASNGIQWYYMNNNYYPNGNAYCIEFPTLMTSDQDFVFQTLLGDNSWQMTKNTFMGFFQGNIPTSYNLSPIYDVNKKIKSAIEDLVNTHNGIDFSISIYIDPVTNLMKKYFNVHYPRQGVDNLSLPFRYPGNIKKISKPRDGKTMWNEIIERGQGQGIAQLTTTVEDSTSIQTYGLRQGVDQQADTSDILTLTSQAREELRVRKDPLDLPEITIDGQQPPAFGSYGIGDTIMVQVGGTEILSFTNNYRIEQIQVDIDDDDVEDIGLTVSLA